MFAILHRYITIDRLVGRAGSHQRELHDTATCNVRGYAVCSCPHIETTDKTFSALDALL